MLSIFKNKKVFLTGHTGFKGAWMLQILQQLGAEVKGYALAPENEQDLYNQIDGDQFCYTSIIGDIRDQQKIMAEIVRFEPDFIFHFAAQALVRKSYEIPVETFETNVNGTIHILEAMRHLKQPCVAVMITTDKVYLNNETGAPFKESDPLGGYDPYSASKAACEIAIQSYRNSYFHPERYAQHQKSIVAMRAGNVIGGGDYASDRIIPDIVTAIQRLEPVTLRNPKAIRPWQHVLEPLFAYLSMAAHLHQDPTRYAPAYNIGPEISDALDVTTVTQTFIDAFGKGSYIVDANYDPTILHEAKLLLLDNQLIKKDINWQPKYTATQAIQMTADWYANKQQTAAEKCKSQILEFMK